MYSRHLHRGRAASRLAVCLAAGLVVLGSQPRSSAAAEFDRTFTFQAGQLTVANLIGAMRVERAPGSEFRVDVHVRGKDADATEIQFDTGEGHDAHLTIQFPVREHRRYVYPKLGPGSRTSFTLKGEHDGEHGDWLRLLLGAVTGERIEVRGSHGGGGLELWADVVVQVPASQRAQVRVGVGSIAAQDVEASLDLRVRSGSVEAEGVKGDLAIDTGSGSVDVRRVQGDLSVDTGSGSVDAADVTGAGTVSLDTGSGSVDARSVAAEALSVDTGSGHVRVENVQVKELSIDTGSGSVEADRVASDDVKIDTGSGGVRLGLVRMGHGKYVVDTGSGGIRMDVPPGASARFDVDTSSGDIDADLEGVTLGRRERHAARFEMGGGDALVTLSTGSGTITLTQGRSGPTGH